MSELVDYAYPCLMAEKYLNDLHNAMLNNDYDAALEWGMRALVEVKMTMNAIKHQKESANELVKSQGV